MSFEFGINVKKVSDPAPVVEPPSIYYCPAPRAWQVDSPDADLSRLYVEVGKAGPDGISKPELEVGLFLSTSLNNTDPSGGTRRLPRGATSPTRCAIQ